MRGRSASEQPVKAQRAARPKARKPQAALESTTDFQEQVAALKRELKEAREQQTATSEVLQVISRSPGELEQIFQTMLEKAVQVCGAKFGILFLSEADGFRTTAMHNVPRAFAEKRAREPFLRPTAGTPLGRVMRTRQVAHIADITTEQGYADGHRPLIDLAELGGARTAVCVPMLNDNELVGAITIYQKEVRPFSDKQIELLTNFAAQAVIAIENARLLNEQRESLERQTATSEVLQVISSSPGELGPVFNAILTNATRICEAEFANLFLYGDNSFRIAAQQDPPPAYAERWRNNPVLAVSDNPRNPLTRLATTKSIVNIIDVMAEPGYIERDPRFVALVESAGARTHLLVPMVKHDELVGAIAIYRQEVRPFTEKQIELVTNFAKQAVIAIENARLLNELRQRTNDLSESLEQQTATSEVLKVISSSPGELHSIFQAVLENAVRICTAKFGGLVLFEGDAYRRVALHNAPAEYLEEQARDPVRPLATSPTLSRVARTKQVIHIADICAEQPEEAIATLGGARTILCVPMLKDERVVGVISIYRHEVRPFTDKQAELVANFAKQAVIAIENTRLLNELRERTDDLSESLEQQTATSEVLKVISSSPGDLEPVFTAMLENATRVCEAKHGFLFRTERNGFRVAAALGDRTAFIEQMRSRAIKPGPLTPIGRLGLTRQIVHVPDLSKDRAYLERDPLVVTAVEQGDVRSVLVVPMIKDGELIGAIGMHRRDVRPFTDKQIELLTNFASQAVIAIENTRLLNELRQRTDDLAESLEQQTATSDVLQVVSSSPGELGPVFEAMLANAVRICRASFGVLFRFEEGSTRAVAMLGVPPAFAEFWQRGPQRPGPRTALGRVIETKQTIHITDVKAEPAYVEGEPVFVAAVNLGGFRSLINVPMLKENELIGTIAIYRQEVKPFTDKEIALVQNFAAQAVIAIENTRLLNELRESLQQQTATSEVLKVISGSSGKLEPVFDAMLENATRICEATYGAMWLRQDGSLRNVAFYGALPAAFSKLWKAGSEISVASGAPVARAVRSGKTIIVPDLKDDAGYRERDHLVVGAVDLGGIRTLIAVPMLKDGEHVGAITIYHREVRPFTEKQIELVQNFAAQAVIAIENTRLLNELRESLQQQTATADVLRVISSSPGDLEPVFQAMLEKATLICEAKFGVMFLYENGSFHTRAMCGVPHALVEERQRNPVVRPSPGTGVGRVLRTKKTVHIADVLMEPEYVNIPEGFTKPGIVQFHGARTELAVPMLKDDELVGTIVIYRTEVRPFTDKQIELVTNFAAQAVIAIENTRLLSELRTRTNELAQSVSELQALGEVSQAVNSTLDLETVLTTIVRRAVELSRTDAGAIYVFNEQREEFRLHATHGMSETMIAAIGSQHIGLGDGNNIATATTERRPVQVADTRDEPASAVNDIVLREGYRSILVIPLLRPDHIVGALVVRRKTPGDFPQSAIELLQTFADQSVVAIQNARLYENVETRTRQLAQSLDDLRTAQDRLVQTQKLASLGQLTAGIAHEIKNPLNFVNNFSVVSSELIDELQQTLKGIPFDDKARAEINDLTTTLRGNLDKVVQHGKRADAIVKNMLLHSREGSGEHRPVDINALVEESLSLAYHGARAEKQGFNITLQRSFDPAAEQADVFPQDITRVLLNLILNGFYAATKRKAEVDSDAYEPTLAVSTHSLGDRVEITVRDNGTGISPEVKEKMFNPFFTTKPAGAGTGLGLSISHDIVVKQHGGSIEVETEPGEYTEFRIIPPRAGAFVTTSGAQS